MKHWESLVDRKVKEVIGDGNISHIPGAGKPLELDDDPNTPDHLRVTYKIMLDNNAIPEWMEKSKYLEHLEDKLRKQISIRADRFLREIKKVRRYGSLIEEDKIEADWESYIDDFNNRVEKYNKEVIIYNLSVPKSIPHKRPLDSKALIQTALNQKGDD